MDWNIRYPIHGIRQPSILRSIKVFPLWSKFLLFPPFYRFSIVLRNMGPLFKIDNGLVHAWYFLFSGQYINVLFSYRKFNVLFKVTHYLCFILSFYGQFWYCIDYLLTYLSDASLCLFDAHCLSNCFSIKLNPYFYLYFNECSLDYYVNKQN